MFGHLAAFVRSNGQMTAGTYGTKINLRLSDADRTEFMAPHKARVFEPMPGRPMREYVVVPAVVHGDEIETDTAYVKLVVMLLSFLNESLFSRKMSWSAFFVIELE